MSVKFKLNGKAVTATAEPDTPLLWVIVPAIANAVAALTSKRLRKLPFTAEAIKMA